MSYRCGYNDLVISFSVLLIKKLKKKNSHTKKIFQLMTCLFPGKPITGIHFPHFSMFGNSMEN